MKRLSLILCFSLLALPAYAASITLKQGEAIALDEYPGEVQDSDVERNVYQYEIEQEDGTQLEIEVNRRSGLITEVEVDEFGARFIGMGEPRVDGGDAKDIAREYLRGQAKRSRSIEVKAARDLLVDGRLVHGIELEMSNVDYKILVDRWNGRVLAAYKFED